MLENLGHELALGRFGRPLHCLEHTNSTNQVAWDLALQGATTGTTVIAQSQNAGRGQWGRTWQSQPGGLYLSVLVQPQALSAAQAQQLTLAAAWGLATALSDYGIPVRLKWPNDLILEGQKLGGILTETRLQRGLIHQAVIGVGINWRNSVPETGINLEAFPELAFSTLTAIVLKGLEQGYTYLDQGEIDAIVPEYLGFLSSLGARIRWAGREGTITGVTAEGDLRLQCDDRAGPLEIQLKPGTIQLGYSGSGEPDSAVAPSVNQGR
ncbi:biotin--[acetyl-CoA-carboxylase] ligase [Leptolyngbya sp. FACHB-261]|uniref:biotin--[acetyl-CoA-carboxylase] ligase n=1 Tax=Leptolyngbya sp. FACHB-261 TaxID=2692806 RepID=UPI00168A371F|nr:biotin--[acetyl-CoA-carboxylase] ligase [Leptolyngbya sp. FACHB-261]MBD2105013.1 biotin--[acetyl-CoA-carboxylase] ligase [Leptolyngbya sp. FACHB-261]